MIDEIQFLDVMFTHSVRGVAPGPRAPVVAHTRQHTTPPARVVARRSAEASHRRGAAGAPNTEVVDAMAVGQERCARNSRPRDTARPTSGQSAPS